MPSGKIHPESDSNSFELFKLPKNASEMFGNWLCGKKIDRHLLAIGCSVVLWTIWKIRNDICFNGRNIMNVTNIFILCCFWLNSWVLNQKEIPIKRLEEGSRLIRTIADQVFNHSFCWALVDRRIM